MAIVRRSPPVNRPGRETCTCLPCLSHLPDRFGQQAGQVDAKRRCNLQQYLKRRPPFTILDECKPAMADRGHLRQFTFGASLPYPFFGKFTYEVINDLLRCFRCARHGYRLFRLRSGRYGTIVSTLVPKEYLPR